MILRRLSQSLKEQNWTAIWIEFVLLIVGVFLGIQVANWNAARVEQKRADELFERLVDDLVSEKNNVDALREYYETAAMYSKVALREFEQPGSVEPETFIIGAYQASQWQEAVSSRSTFEEIVATGAVNLVRNEKARTMLIAYYEYDWTKALTPLSRPHYRDLMRGVMPYPIQESIKAACGDQTKRNGRAILTWLPKQCDIAAPAADIERAAAALRAAPGMEQALRYQLAENDTKVDNYAATSRQLAPLIVAIKEGVR